MSAGATTPAVSNATSARPVAAPTTSTRLADYLELTKPRIAVMALITVTIGYTLGCAGDWQFLPLLHALLGITLVAAASSAINQWFEIETDALMLRTARRPLPAGRLTPNEALLFGLVTGIAGTAYLAVQVNPLTAALALATLLLYAGVYTPLKQRTSFCTAIGAIPGALPPVLGWTAASGEWSFGATMLFGILFLWQFPHFLAIAWLYRQQYAEAGLRMLPAFYPRPRVVGLMSVIYALALLPVSLLPGEFGLAGQAYSVVALLLGLSYLASAIRFCWHESTASARGVLYTSLLYLPILLIALTADHLQLLQ